MLMMGGFMGELLRLLCSDAGWIFLGVEYGNESVRFIDFMACN